MNRFILLLGGVVAVTLVLTSGAAPLQAGPVTTGTPPLTNTPSPTPTARNTPIPTNTPTFTATYTPSITPTPSDTPTATFTPTITPTPSPTPIGPYSYPEGVNPLTGLPYPNEAAMNRRPLIVKVSNWPPVVRPQSGLSFADIVFEYEAEGGVTRFAAIFRSQSVDHVGSVRSGRLIDLELIEMFRALFAYSGSSDPIRQLILNAEWRWRVFSPHIGDNEPLFARFPEEGLAFEHTLFANLDEIWAAADVRNVNTGMLVRGLAFTEVPAEGGSPASQVFVDWWGETDATWQYNAADGYYYRWNSGVPHIDKLTGEQIRTRNVVVLGVPHAERPDLFEPESKTNSLEIQLWDVGQAYILRDGLVYQGWWQRRERNEDLGLQLTWGDNTPIPLRPGNTWFEVVREGMPGVFIGQELGDMQATGTVAAPRLWTPTPEATPAS